MGAKLNNGQTVTGAGPELDTGANKGNYTVSAEFPSTITALAITVEARVKSGVLPLPTAFVPVFTYTAVAGDLSAGNLMFHIVDKPVDIVRLNITTLTGTPGVGVSAWITAKQ